MAKTFIVYETDCWNSTASRRVMGTFTSLRSAINAIVKHHEIPLEEIFDEWTINNTSRRVLEIDARKALREQLERNKQTQGYDTNYDIEEFNNNEWEG